MRIHPAILVDTLSEYKEQLSQLVGLFKEVDVDIINWKRTATSTINVDQALDNDYQFEFTFDLMVDDPSNDMLKLFQDQRVKKILVNTQSGLINIDFYLQKIRAHKIKAGVAICPEIGFSELINNINFKLVDFFQVYTVEPGSQGNPFLEKRLELVKKLMETGKEVEIDGGVNLKTAKVIRKYKPDILSVGSVFSKTEEDKKILSELQNALK